MEKMTLERIEKNGTSIRYIFTAEGNLGSLFTGKPFDIDFREPIEDVPDAVLAVPFVSNVLPIIWLEDAELIVPELDEDFFCSIPEFKKGFVAMYPEAHFGGKVSPVKTVSCRPAVSEGCAMFFSGGMDATTTLLRHIEEMPDLISLWGTDVEYDNAEGWSCVQKAIDETAESYSLSHINIHSSIREFYREGELNRRFNPVLHHSWWPGIQCGIGLLGHAAPHAWIHHLAKVYIASSYSIWDKEIVSGTDPSIDNFVRYCGATVDHDGFELNRAQKAAFLVDYHRKNPRKPIRLHVCWKSTDGKNCCHCEKCYRTMVCFWAAGDDPRKYGMNYQDDVLRTMYRDMALRSETIDQEWQSIQSVLLKNREKLTDKSYYPNIKWIETFDFEHPERNRCHRLYRIATFQGARHFIRRGVRFIARLVRTSQPSKKPASLNA